MPPKQHYKPVSIDDAFIDFSAVKDTKKQQQPEELVSQLLAERQADAGDGKEKASEMRAFDPALQTYSQRAAVGRRRRTLFGGGGPAPVPSGGVLATSSHSVNALPSASTEGGSSSSNGKVLDAQEQIHQLLGPDAGPTLRERRAAYEASLHAFCTSSLTTSGGGITSAGKGTDSTLPVGPTQNNSFLRSFFNAGVPDIEPWDRWAFGLPRYDPKALVVRADNAASVVAAKLDLVHHPILPDSHYTLHYQHEAASRPVQVKLMKTKEELRAERNERVKQKQERLRRERAEALAKSSAAGVAGGKSSAADRLSKKTILTHSLTREGIVNPLTLERAVAEAYEKRFHDHQLRNHERHVAALPAQIARRERDAVRHATENPLLRAYRIYPIYSPAHLGKLRKFANDNLLRGCVLWIANCDSVVIVAGGEVAVRHMDRWILDKMEWESPETQARRLCSVPLCKADTFSFHQKSTKSKRARMEDGEAKDGKHEEAEEDNGKEAVFMNFVATVGEGEKFLRQLPAAGGPWLDLACVWRAAFLQDGLAGFRAGAVSKA